MKRLLWCFVAVLLLCSCKNNFEDYLYHASYFPELSADAEIKLQCSFLRIEGESEAMISVKQLDSRGEIMKETGDVTYYTINKDKLNLSKTLSIGVIDKNGRSITFYVDYVSYSKDGLFMLGKYSKGDYYQKDNQVTLSFSRGEMNSYVAFMKKYGK